MYKILIKHIPSTGQDKHMWYAHGTTTTSNETSTFNEFETDDIKALEEELLKLDKIFGHENITAYSTLDITYGVEIAVGESEENTDESDGSNDTGNDDSDIETNSETT